jgi:[ribosomal protein S5]-alanine N-acetyltransferase
LDAWFGCYLSGGIMEIETKRLIFQKVSIDHTSSLFDVFGDPKVMKYWYGGADKNLDETQKRVMYLTQHWDVYGFGDWSIFSKTHSKIIGFAGLHYIKDVPEVNIGYAFSRAYWGQGFATEACQDIIKYGFESISLNQIVAVIWPDNQASIKLAKKCGFELLRNIIWHESDRVVYSLKKETRF